MSQLEGSLSQPVSGSDLCAYLAGEVTAEEKLRIESALADSAALRRELRELEAVWRLLEKHVAPEPPPEGLADLHRRLKTIPLPVRRSGPLPRYAVAFIAASFIIAVGLYLSVTNETLTPNTAREAGGKSRMELLAEMPAASAEAPQRLFTSGDGFLRAEEAVVPDSVDEGIAKVGPERWNGRTRIQEYPINNFAYRGQVPVASPSRVKTVVFGPM
jgi:hypothetical protein